MKIRVLTLCLWAVFSLFYASIAYSEVKKAEVGIEKKSNCKECHSRGVAIKGSAKPTVQGQSIGKDDDKLIPPPDHIRKDKRKNKGQ